MVGDESSIMADVAFAADYMPDIIDKTEVLSS